MRNPYTATAFEWDDANESKMALRGIYPCDVESVYFEDDEMVLLPNKRSRTATWLMVGRDYRGRRLKVGILWSDETDGVMRAIWGTQLE